MQSPEVSGEVGWVREAGEQYCKEKHVVVGA